MQLSARSESLGRVIQGEFRLRVFPTKLLKEIKEAYPEMDREAVLALCGGQDSGWLKNVVTDFGRRFLLANAFTTTPNLFIHEMTSPANVRRSALQFTYANQTPSQIRAPDSTVNDLATLLQTRTVQYPAPSVTRTINTVGLTAASAGATELTSHRTLYGILAYTKLTTPVVQDTLSTADLQYRVSWSLN